MNPKSRYNGPNILIELKQARADFRQACKGDHQVKKSKAERHIWALKGLYKSVTETDPPETESDDELSGLELTEEATSKEAEKLIQNAKKVCRRKQEKSSGCRSRKRKLTLAESYLRSIPQKIRKLVPQSEKDSSESSQLESEDENPQKRKKFSCPLRCGARVCQLPRHLRNVHGWHAERARNAVNHYLGQKEYCDLRNFLFIHILAQNGHRSGVITNSTLDEYKKICCVDGTYMVAVKDHKTFSQHGQANICFDESLKAWVDVYVDHARRQVATGDKSNALFLNFKGGKMKSGDLSSALTSAWRKAGMIDNETRISGTLMRKSCTTAIRQYNKDVKGNVAAHMAHSERTADKHYHLVQKRTNSAFAARQLAAVMHGRVSPTASSHLRNQDCEESSAREGDCELGEVHVPLTRQSWTEEEEKVIQEVFADQIKRQSVTLKEVITLKEKHSSLRSCENKRLLDKVRGLYRFKKMQNVGVDDNETSALGKDTSDFSSIISPSTNQSKARVFEDQEVNLFKDLFKDMIQRGQKIEQGTVVERLKQSGHEQIIEKYNKQKVTDKIRGLRSTHIREWRK